MLLVYNHEPNTREYFPNLLHRCLVYVNGYIMNKANNYDFREFFFLLFTVFLKHEIMVFNATRPCKQNL